MKINCKTVKNKLLFLIDLYHFTTYNHYQNIIHKKEIIHKDNLF